MSAEVSRAFAERPRMKERSNSEAFKWCAWDFYRLSRQGRVPRPGREAARLALKREANRLKHCPDPKRRAPDL